MITIYFKTAWRSLRNQKWQASLSIGGLALGMAATLLIGLWVYDELSYNTQYGNHPNIARVKQHQTFNGEVRSNSNVPWQLAPELRATYGEHFEHVVCATFSNEIQFTLGDTKISRRGNFMEPGIADMLDLQMVLGSREALQDPNSILLSESTAKALFGSKNPLEEEVKLGSSTFMKIGGVYVDFPINSDFKNLTFIGPWKFLFDAQGYEKRLGWGNNWFQTLVQIKEGSDMAYVSSVIEKAKLNHLKKSGDSNDLTSNPLLSLHPMNKWRLYSRFENGVNVGGRIDRVWLLGIIGVFILLLACINFMNLSTARSIKRAKEVGIRKTIGSRKKQLMSQFLSESFLVVGISLLIALILVLIGQDAFNALTTKSVQIPWGNPVFWGVLLVFLAITSFLSGSYPSFYLSSFMPAQVLKGTFHSKQGASHIRKGLVVFQFAISALLIIGTITVFQQIQYVQNRPTNYTQDGMLYVPIKTPDIVIRFNSLREELLQSPDIEEVAASDVLMTGTYTTNSGFEWKGKDPSFSEEFNTLRATHGYGEMVEWELVQGRNFSREFATDSMAFILNETAVAYMGLDNPIGEFVQWGDNGSFKVVGVVKDMVTRSPYGAITPMIYTLHYGRFLSYINIKIGPKQNLKNTLAHIESVFKKYNPKSLFTYGFLDEEYAEYFEEEVRTGKLVGFFALLAILISCLGIFGLASFVAEQRTKEIGVRKVLGASVYSLWKMLSQDFLVLVFISSIIAVPIGYYYMKQWVADFTYNVNLSWWIFAAAIMGVLSIALLTVSFQTVRAALANPVKSLRTE